MSMSMSMSVSVNERFLQRVRESRDVRDVHQRTRLLGRYMRTTLLYNQHRCSHAQERNEVR